MGRVVSAHELAKITDQLHAEKKKIVFTNGICDLLHPGHVWLLEASKKLGDVLVVGINSDASTRSFKGPKRPIYSQDDRATLLCALACVDYVTIYEETDPKRLFALIRPDIWTKSTTSDPARFQAECAEVEKYGGKGVRMDPHGNYSVSNTIKTITERYCT
ncbi:adenylyltransferase/cytidyltransferase family protein [Candidatus Woesearchaeota archaeon]|nr:adenylyltransferase/cytidyltransferase family protein [Candidatus Woesearchaeota archaeon]